MIFYPKEYSKVPRIRVDAVVKKGGGFILVKRDVASRKGYWYLPGGTVKLGEPLREAVRRVVRKETGLRVKVKRQLRFLEYSRSSGLREKIGIAFTAEAKSGFVRCDENRENVKIFQRVPKKVIPEQTALLHDLEFH